MSAYNEPTEILPVYNPSNFISASDVLSVETADLRYLRLSGGIENGLVAFGAGLSSTNIAVSSASVTTPPLTFVGNTTTGIYQPATNQIGLTVNSAPAMTVTSASVRITSGSVLAPSLSILSNTATGLYQPNTDQLGFSLNTTGSVIFTSASVRIPSGSVLAPSLSILSNTATGLYQPASNQLGITLNTTNTCLWTTEGTTLTGKLSVPNASFTSISVTGIVDCSEIELGDGTVSFPSLSFQPGVGMYVPTASQLGLTMGNTQGVLFTSASARFSSGSVLAPSITILSNTVSGIYQPAVNQLGLSLNTTNTCLWTTVGMTIAGILTANDGLVAGNTTCSAMNVGSLTCGGTSNLNIVNTTQSVAKILTATTATLLTASVGAVDVSNYILLPSGSSSLPSLNLGGSPSNSGIYSPATDQVAVVLRTTATATFTTASLNLTGCIKPINSFIQVRKTNGFTLANNTNTAWPYNVTTSNIGSSISLATGSVFRNVSGYTQYWKVTACLALSSYPLTNYVSTYIWVNTGTTIVDPIPIVSAIPLAGGVSHLTVSGVVEVPSQSYVGVNSYQNSGTTLTTALSATYPNVLSIYSFNG